MPNEDSHVENSQAPSSPGYQRRSQPGGDTNFLTWTDGETKALTVVSKFPVSERRHWVDGKSQPCAGDDCALCAAGAKATLRWSVEVECEGEERSWGMSNQVCDQLETIAEMVGRLEGLTVQVKRQGTGLNTRYTIVPLTKAPWQAETHDDLEGQAKYVKTLCQEWGLDPKALMAEFRENLDEELETGSEIEQMAAFCQYVEYQVEVVAQKEKEQESDIGDYF